MKTFNVVSVNVSATKGTVKTPVPKICLVEDSGVKDDAHAGGGDRQVSLLAREDIEWMRNQGATVEYGSFAENITTEGIDLPALPLGTRLFVNDTELEVSRIGKECHAGCAIRQQVGDCIMPRRGIFVRVIKGGTIPNGSTGTYNI